MSTNNNQSKHLVISPEAKHPNRRPPNNLTVSNSSNFGTFRNSSNARRSQPIKLSEIQSQTEGLYYSKPDWVSQKSARSGSQRGGSSFWKLGAKGSKKKDPVKASMKSYSHASEGERDEKILSLKKSIRNYQILMYMVAINSACGNYIKNFVIFYLKSKLDINAADAAFLTGIINLPWSLKPIWGFISDSISLFKYRFKSHILIQCIAGILSVLYFVIKPEPNTSEFVTCLTIFTISVTYVDSLAEGISAMITKNEQRVRLLEVMNREQNEEKNDKNEPGQENSTKAFGMFNAIRSLVTGFMMLLGGYMATVQPLSVSGMILSIWPTVMILVVLFVFKEERKDSWFMGCKMFRMGVSSTVKAILIPEVFFPFIFMVIALSAPSTYPEFSYVLLGPGGLSFNDYNTITFFSQFMVSIVLFIVIKLGDYLPFNQIILLAQFFSSAAVVFGGLCLYTDYFPPYTFSVFWVFIIVSLILGQNIYYVSLAGRISKYLPEGYECTGITTVVSATALAVNVNGYFAKPYLNYFEVKDGYYERLQTPQFISSAFQIFFVLITTLFGFMK